jgi:hypothetical protein
VRRLQGDGSRRQQHFVPGAADLEENPVLPLQHHLAVVAPPRLIHDAVDLNEAVPRQALVRFECRCSPYVDRGGHPSSWAVSFLGGFVRRPHPN